MRYNYVLAALGLILLVFSVVFLAPLFVAIYYKDFSSIIPFISTGVISIALGLLFRRFGVKSKNFNDLKKKEAFLIVSLTWVLISAIIGIPYLFYGLSPLNAFFEAVSGFTTTGATILTDYSLYPKVFFFWRSLSQWLGGLGIIVLFIGILPQFAVAGRQMFFAEAPGPTEDKITPRVKNTAKALWGVYLLLTVVEICLLKMAGMPLFDSVCNSLSTIAAGGFSPNPNSILGYGNNLYIWIITIFMFLSGLNFSLQYRAIFNFNLKSLFTDTECRLYTTIILIASLLLGVSLYLHSEYSVFDSFTHSFFQIIATITTTGFASINFDEWQMSSKCVLLLMVFIGGCAGSASGGIKVIRTFLVFKYLKREIFKIMHPNAVIPIKVNRKVISSDVIKQVIGFVIFYFVILILSSALTSMIENDFEVGIVGTIATLGNIGAGLGSIGPFANYDSLSVYTKIIFIVNMLIGRIELIPFLAMLHPDFWKMKRNIS